MGRLLDSRFYTIALLLLVTLFSACSKEAETFVKKKFFLQETDDGLAPLYISNKRGLTPISANYLVVLKDNINPDEVDFKADIITEFLSSQKDKVFKNALKAFTIRLSSKDLQKVRKDPNVKYVEQDQVMKITATQFTAPWGLDRIDQVGIPLSGSYTYETTGSSVDAYIFDTGIRADHNEFIGRIRPGYNAISSTAVPNDDNGHGTHVSGILGGTRYGVAKGINIIPVKVLDAFGTGTISQIIAGIDWAIVNHTTRPSVGNVSISGPVSVSLDEAIRRAIKDGIVMCVAAGNNSVDVSTTTPGRIEEAIVVGSVTNTDQWSSFSNFGTIIDILAPGTSITSAWHTGINDINVVSGTSMATPHVAGAAALYLEKFPGTTPSNVQNGLKSSSVGDRILLVPAGTSNALLNINFLPPPPPIPLAPSLISPGNASTDHPANLTLSWSASANATTYGLQVSTNSNFSTLLFNDIGITSPSKLLSSLAQGTTYYWRTNATNVSGTSQWSVVNSFTTVAAPVVVIPSAPLLNSPSNMATSQVTAPTLVWSAVSGATSYGLQVSSNVNFSTTVINQTGLTSLSSAVSGLTAGATYYWRVNASNSLGTGAWSTVYSFSTSTAVVPPGGSILSVPSLQTPADRATNISRTPTLTWSTVPGAVTFDIQISTATAFTSTAVNLTGVTSNSVQISTLLASRRLYYWRVRAVNGASVSGWSAVRRFTTVR